MAVFYNQKDQDIYKTSKFMPQSRFLLNAPKPVVEEEKMTESFGIPQTQAFTNSGGGGGGIQTLDPYNRPQGKPLDPNSFLGKTFTGLKNFGGTVVDKFSGLPGVEQGKGLIRNIMDNTMIGRFAAMRDPLNPNASNYNKALQGQIDYLSGLSVDGNMMIGRDPGTGLGKYGPDSVLSGQNVVSGFGTNDYMGQLQKNLKRLEGYKNPNDKTFEMIEKTKAEIAALEEEDDKNYSNRQKGLANKIREQIKNKTIDPGFNIHNDAGQGKSDPNDQSRAGSSGRRPGSGGNVTATAANTNKETGTTYDSGGREGFGYGLKEGGRAGYFFGGRVNFKDGGLASIL